MSKTAIVPVDSTAEMDRAARRYDSHPEPIYQAMLTARPPVPDELIEEAAKAMREVGSANLPCPWGKLPENWREEYRNMARAAARVFNGQMCSSFCAAGEPCSISDDGHCFLGGCNG